MRNKQKIYIMAALAAAIVLIGLATWWQLSRTTDTDQLQPPTTSQPEPQYLNAGKLIEIGVTEDQLRAMKIAFRQFKPDVKQVVIFSNSVKSVPRDPASDIFAVDFTVTVDNTMYRARLDYFNLNAVRLHLDDQAGKRIFDTQSITAE